MIHVIMRAAFQLAYGLISNVCGHRYFGLLATKSDLIAFDARLLLITRANKKGTGHLNYHLACVLGIRKS